MNEYHYIREGQPGSELFTFVVGSEDLLQFARVERFNEVEEGVQRQLNYGHVLKLADFMRQPSATLAEPILGDLRGPWEFDTAQHVVRRGEDAYLLVDDGQQRLAALHLLKPEERLRWEFKVTASVSTPYKERLQRFIQQLKRLKLDTHLVWQIQDRGDLFPDGLSKAAYQLAKRLAVDSESPLAGLIRLQERSPRRQPVGNDTEALHSLIGTVPPTQFLREQTLGIVNVSAILRDLRQLVASPHSLLHWHTPEQRFQMVVKLLNAAKELWPLEWDDYRQYFLRRSDGISALIQLFVVGTAFKECLTAVKTLGKRFGREMTQSRTLSSPGAIYNALGHAQRFDWSFRQFRAPGMKFPGPVEIARQLDALIFRSVPRKRSQGSGEAVGVGTGK